MKTTKQQRRDKVKVSSSKKVVSEAPRKKRAKKGERFKLEARPLTESQIKMFLEFYEENGSFPGSKIPCNVTGKLTTCVGPWLRKKVAEFGSAEKLLRRYVCRGAIKVQKEASKPFSKKKAAKKALKEMKVDEKVWDLPKVDLEAAPRPLSAVEIGECTTGCCLRPDLYLNNDYACNGCEFFEDCRSHLKCVSKKLLRKVA
jgi:hypothetical protein